MVAKSGELALGAGVVPPIKNTYKVSSVNLATRMCKDGNAIAINKGKTNGN
jgi:hypothetical protein